jgi:endonuclease YncB( thermonuclease family)
VDAYDADTVTLAWMVGGAPYRVSARLVGIDAPEMKSADPEVRSKAMQARDMVVALAAGDDVSETVKRSFASRKEARAYLESRESVVWVEVCGSADGTMAGSQPADKYGRVLAVLRRAPGEESFADVLVEKGLAYRYDGGTKLTEEQQKAAMYDSGLSAQ